MYYLLMLNTQPFNFLKFCCIFKPVHDEIATQQIINCVSGQSQDDKECNFGESLKEAGEFQSGYFLGLCRDSPAKGTVTLGEKTFP